LVEKHTEQTIRQILVSLSQVDNFIPASGLEKAKSAEVPLIELVRRYDIPWLYFENITNEQGLLRVDVSHGINMAAVGETFLFKEENNALVLVERYERWIS
jgi:hypothetical protein